MTYGLGTRSYNRSAEARQNKQAVREATRKYLDGKLVFRALEILTCACRSFELPHNPERHKELLSDHDWRSPKDRQGQKIFKERIR
jgi:hypothetical protein